MAYHPETALGAPAWSLFWHQKNNLPMKTTDTTELTFPLSGDTAKKLVFEHWDFLQHLSRRRFPNDDNTAHLALDHVLEKLEEQQWHRVRTWSGQGKFATFLAVLTARLMTDYVRKIYGHQRPPKWLTEQTDPIWKEAYRVLILERFERQEAISLLQTRYQDLNLGSIQEIVSQVIAYCPSRTRYQDSHSVPIEDVAEPGSRDYSPEIETEPQPRELLEVLEGYIRGETPQPAEAKPLLEKLQPHLQLSDEDRLLLRLRYCEGLKINQVAKLMHLKGDPYKRLNKILNSLHTACEKAGLT